MKNRPLSPHLTIYKPQITSIVSIFHRISGSCLALSAIFLMFIFYSDIIYSEYYICYSQTLLIQFHLYWLFSSFYNLICILFVFHISNGVRHLIWDFAIGLDNKNITATGICVLTITLFVLFLILL